MAQRQYYRTLGKAVTKGCRAFIPGPAPPRSISGGRGAGEDRPVVHSGIDTAVYRP